MATSQTSSRNIAAGLACGVAAGAAWGLVFLAPHLLSSFSPIALSLARYLVYGLVSLILVIPVWRTLSAQVTRRDWIALLRLSAAGNLIYYVFLAAAVQLGGITIASFIVGLLPVVITIIGTRQAHALALRSLALPLAIIAAGIAFMNQDLFTAPGGGDALQKLGGIACALVALVAWTYYAVENARYLEQVPHLSNKDWSLLTGIATGALALIFAPLMLVGDPGHDAHQWMQFWALNAALAIAASVVGNAFWNAASRLLPLTLSGQMIIFETLFALLYAFMLEQRFPRPLEALAILCLVTGVTLSARLHRARSHGGAS